MFYNLNKNVKHLRKQKGLTQPQLAEIIGMKYKSLDCLEGGRSNASLEILDKIHNVFEISLDDLVYKDLSKASDKII